MTISLRGTAVGLGAAADTNSPFGSQNYSYPTGFDGTSDIIFAICGAKFSTASQYSNPLDEPTASPIAAGTTVVYNIADWVAEGTTTTGNGSGSAFLQVNYSIQAHSSSTHNNPVQTHNVGYSPSMIATIAFQKTNPGLWTVEATDAIDVTATGTTFVLTGATQLNFTSGDVVMLVTCHNDNVTNESEPSITIPGCTVGTITERLSTNSTATGNDGSLWCYTAEITSGTATGVPSASITTASGESNGVAVFVRINEPLRTSDEYWGMLPI